MTPGWPSQVPWAWSKRQTGSAAPTGRQELALLPAWIICLVFLLAGTGQHLDHSFGEHYDLPSLGQRFGPTKLEQGRPAQYGWMGSHIHFLCDPYGCVQLFLTPPWSAHPLPYQPHFLFLSQSLAPYFQPRGRTWPSCQLTYLPDQYRPHISHIVHSW